MRWSLGTDELTVPLVAHRLRRQVSVEDLSEDIGDVEDRVLGGGRIVYARRKCDQRDVGKLAYAVAGVLLHGPGRADQHRLRRWFSREEVKVLLVAGGATGVAAIFKAPATGALFAMEVPFQADLARRPPLSFRDLAAAGCIGLLVGVGVRGFAALVRVAKERSAQIHPVGRVVAAGAVIGALILVSEALTAETLALGPSYRTIAWTFEADHAIGVVLAMLVIRGAATVAAVGGGGVGGLFIPLATEGALLGRVVGGLVGMPESTLFPVLGVAAFLGAGYRVPLAAVMFVAESTGRPGFVVPGLIAAAVSQLTMGPRSVSIYQQARRPGHLEDRLDLPITSVLRTDAATVPSDASVADLYEHHMLGVRLLAAPVVDGSTYVGIVTMGEILKLSELLDVTTDLT